MNNSPESVTISYRGATETVGYVFYKYSITTNRRSISRPTVKANNRWEKILFENLYVPISNLN